jgi:hypothetical protein|tara:strand:- start:270 stop:455 length:186 start_codon:yes stop_codon:yes gene_type:complete
MIDRKKIAQQKSRLKRKRPIRKPFPNRWEQAQSLSRCCNGQLEGEDICKLCKQPATFRLVL